MVLATESRELYTAVVTLHTNFIRHPELFQICIIVDDVILKLSIQIDKKRLILTQGDFLWVLTL